MCAHARVAGAHFSRLERKGERTPTSPHLTDVLAEQLNALTILDMGRVEFVLHQLTSLTSEGDNCCGDLSRLKVLQALTELADNDGGRREIMARGEKLFVCFERERN